MSEEYIWVCRQAYYRAAAFRDRSSITQVAAGQGIDLVIDERGDDDSKSYARAIERAVARKPGAILVTAPDDRATVQAVDAAVKAGIPVVTVAEDLPLSNRSAHVGTDWFRMGSVMAAHVIALTNGAGDIIPVASRSTANIHAAWSALCYRLRNEPGLRLPDASHDGPMIGPSDASGWSTLLETHSDPAIIVAFDAESIPPLLDEPRNKTDISPVSIIGVDSDCVLPAYVQTGQIQTVFVPRIAIAALQAVALVHEHDFGSSSSPGYRRDVGHLPGHIDVGFDIVKSESPESAAGDEDARLSQIAGETDRLSSYLSQLSDLQSLDLEDEARTRAILNAIPDPIFRIDNQGRFTGYKADRSEDLFLPPEEFLGKSIYDVLPPHLADTTNRHLQKALRTGCVESYEYELEIGGETLQFEARMAAAGPSDVIAIVRNITDRKRAEEALRESEERFRVAFNTSPDAISISRIDDGLYIDINDGFATLSGYSRNEVIGKSVLELGIWDDPKDRHKFVEALRSVGHITNLEAKFRLKDGRIRTGLSSARIIMLNGVSYILSVTRDITDWKKAEEALRESEERFRAVFETAHDAIYIKDHDLKYVAVNPSMAKLFDIPRTQFVGMRYEDVFGQKNAGHNREVETRVLNGEIVIEESIRTIADREHIFHVVIVPLRINGGEIVGLCGIAREITETRRLQETAERAARLETAGTIAGQVAHDFNNLLGPLMAYPDIIRGALSPGSEAHQLLDDMEHAAEQMADINQQLLTLGRRGYYTRESFSLNEIVRQVVDRMPPPRKNLSVAAELAGDLKLIIGGPAQVYRVVSNLVANAYDAMKHGGRLTIRTENVYLDAGAGKHTFIPGGEYVGLIVSDTGSGIPDDILPNIFDPFFTTRKTAKKRGSGLGLSVVHSVIEDHGGYIDVDSTPGAGTTFRVYLPVTDEEIENAADEEIMGGNERILVVDDDHTQLDVVKTMLGKLGYTVHCAKSGEKALEILSRQEFDLLLLDMVMPSGINGTETYRRALELRPGQSAIMMSGFAETKQVAKALKLGAGMFIRKPFSLTMLANAIRKELEEKVGNPADD